MNERHFGPKVYVNNNSNLQMTNSKLLERKSLIARWMGKGDVNHVMFTDYTHERGERGIYVGPGVTS